MNLRHQSVEVIAAISAIAFATTAQAATVTFATKQLTAGSYDITNLKGASEEAMNVNEGDNDATYIADDRPTQGQTFTTGANATGYVLRAVTLREVPFDTYALVPDLAYTIRITQPADKNLKVLSTETAKVTAETPGNFATIGDGGETGIGSGHFITFTLDKPVTLKPNTTYGFDVAGGADRHYWQWDGTDKDAYRGGAAYSVLPKGKMTERTGDHVFVVGMSPVMATETGKASANAAKAAQAGGLADSGSTAVSK